MRAEERLAGKDTGDGRFAGDGATRKPASSAVRSALDAIAEIREYAAHLLAAKKDAVKLKVQRAAILAAVGILGALAALTLIASALVLLLVGLAQGLGEILGGRAWLGQVIVGAGFLALIAAAIVIGIALLKRSSFKKTVAKYERRQARQRAAFGRDISSRLPGDR